MKKKLTIALIILMLISLISGCGSADSSSTSSMPMAAADTVEEYTSDSNGFYSYADEDLEAPAPYPQEAAGSAQSLQASALSQAKLIYSADISLQTTEFDSATEKMAELVSQLGGYFESSSVNNYSSYRYGNYTVRVPAESFESFCTQVGQLCQINYISRSADDVSEVYYDTEARLTTQQTKLERLQELLSKAESMEDIITIESAISETELAIENLTGSLRRYDSLIGYSTVYISLEEVYRLDDVEQPAIGFGAKLVSALKTGCSRFSSGLQGLLLSLASNWVGWLIFILIAAAAVLIVRRRVIKRRRKAADSGGESQDGK